MLTSFLSRPAKLAAVIAATLTFAACAKNTTDEAALGAGAFGAGAGGGSAPGTPGDFAANVGDRIYFESDQSDLTPTAQATLDKQARWLTEYARYSFTVEGHADERGTREYNFALGARRAEAEKEYLIAKGIPAARMHSISYGKERPVAVCNDISCWSQNRRAVTVLKGAGQS